MMMVGMTMTGAEPVSFFLKDKTQQNGFKKVLKQMMNSRQKVQTLIYLRCVHYL